MTGKQDPQNYCHLVPKELLEVLDRLHPERAPSPNDSTAELWMKAGERRIINILWYQYNLQFQTMEADSEED